MRANMTVLCGFLAWPTSQRGNHGNRFEDSDPVVIPTAATVEVADFAISHDTQRLVSIVRYQGRTYTAPTTLLATPAEAFRSLKKGK